MSGRHAANSSKKPLIIVICAVVLVALIAGAVILFMNFSGKNDNSATTVPTSAISTTAVNTDSTQNISGSASEPTQPATESGVTSQEPTEQGFTSESSDNDSEIVVPTISGEEQKPKFSATLVPYYAKDENSSEEVSLRDLSVRHIQAAASLLTRTELSLTVLQIPRQIRVRILLRAIT